MRSLPWLLLLASCAGSPTEPRAEHPFGPHNRWWHANTSSIPVALQGSGYAEGSIAIDFVLEDQFGDRVRLYQFYGRPVVLDLITMWCTPCRQDAPKYQALWEDHGDRGLMVIAVLQQDRDGLPPEPADAEAWVETFGLTHPVLVDPHGDLEPWLLQAEQWPTVPVIDREMTVVEDDAQEVEEILGAVALEALPTSQTSRP